MKRKKNKKIIIIRPSVLDCLKDELIKEYEAGVTYKEIKEKFDIKVTERSIQRFLEKYIKLRDKKHPIAKINRAEGLKRWWSEFKKKHGKGKNYSKSVPSSKTRYEILKRDGFKCVLCGATAQDDALVVDHIVPKKDTFNNSRENLRTLCYTCNVGRNGVDYGIKSPAHVKKIKK